MSGRFCDECGFELGTPWCCNPTEQYRLREEHEKELERKRTEKVREYRELVKVYAGQFMAGMISNPDLYTGSWDTHRKWGIEQAHALAKEVLASLSIPTEKAE